MVPTATIEPTEDNMDAIWSQFLQDKVNSFTKWDLVRFFHENPYTTDTAENIAQSIARDEVVVKYEMDELVQVGVLERAEKIQGYVYRFAVTPETRSLITAFIDACHSRDFRRYAINKIIHSGKFTPRYDF